MTLAFKARPPSRLVSIFGGAPRQSSDRRPTYAFYYRMTGLSPDCCFLTSNRIHVPAFEPATMEPAALEMSKMERRNSAAVKRRVSRACDHCHRMRTRCNGNWVAPHERLTLTPSLVVGQAPCSRCIGTSWTTFLLEPG